MDRRALGAGLIALLAAGCGSSPPPLVAEGLCAPGREPLRLEGEVTPAEARSYRMVGFAVAPGTGRIELGYGWADHPGPPGTPLTATTLDLGLWGPDGYREPGQFRGWSGSRQGRMDLGQDPVFVQADAAERGYLPGPIRPGLWYAEIGIAAVSQQGARWQLTVVCKAAAAGAAPDDPVDPAHVARDRPGWYHGDFHMHAYHSNPNAPDWDGFIAQAREASLDFLMVTEYVTGAHWRTLGAVQRANPDLLIWPGREIITYFGHASTHGETPQVLEYRHGFEDVSLGTIQRQAVDAGALFQVNHPTSFPGPVFRNFCRGCEFELADAIDWSLVDTIEVLNGPARVTPSDIGGPAVGTAENPFTSTAIALWERLLREGHFVTAVSGSDSKGVDAPAERARKGYGSSATAVYAERLSRPALIEAIRAGRAYVRTLGVAGSPEVAFTILGEDGTQGTYGSRLAADRASLRTVVRGGAGQTLRYFANGQLVLAVPVAADPFVHEMAVTRMPDEGPLGTYWRIELHDGELRTVIGNPVFLTGAGG